MRIPTAGQPKQGNTFKLQKLLLLNPRATLSVYSTGIPGIVLTPSALPSRAEPPGAFAGPRQRLPCSRRHRKREAFATVSLAFPGDSSFLSSPVCAGQKDRTGAGHRDAARPALPRSPGTVEKDTGVPASARNLPTGNTIRGAR